MRWEVYVSVFILQIRINKRFMIHVFLLMYDVSRVFSLKVTNIVSHLVFPGKYGLYYCCFLTKSFIRRIAQAVYLGLRHFFFTKKLHCIWDVRLLEGTF